MKQNAIQQKLGHLSRYIMQTVACINVHQGMCARENSDQPALLRSLIRVFTIRLKKDLITGFPPSRKHTYIILTPLKPHFYIVKLGFTGVYIILLISARKHRLWLLVRTASNEYPHSMFWAEIWKILEFFIWKFSVFFRWNLQYILIGVFS